MLCGFVPDYRCAILQMLKMTHMPQYRAGDQIKAHVLYFDYRMSRR
jgi:hypothetical protein